PVFDIVFVVAGVATQAGTPAALLPREVAAATFQTNAISPIRFAEAFRRRVAADGLMVLMTSKLGSVSLNRGGGWSSYRASKAALNKMAPSFAG
ncbi:SDR family oxidoreductase, partial [Methylobacterium brachiatum]